MGDSKHDGLAIPGRVVLAHEPPFTVGTVRVHPATRQVEHLGRKDTLEPRVMQALVALFRAQGEIVTRDELIERCWEGRIVTDDAINRVLSRIRHVASGIGEGSFAVETIARVGYRITQADPPRTQIKRPPEAKVDRRGLLAGATAAATVAAAGGLLWLKPWRHRPSAEARELYRRGDLAQRAGFADQSRQSVSYFENAVRADPLYADAWGALALAYTHNLDGFGEAELASLPGRIRAAARRALELDPDQPDALVALACIKPFFRNWAQSEAKLRDLVRRFPDHWLANGRLAICLYQVGRFLDGAAFHEKMIERNPMNPGPYAFAAEALSNAGRAQDAEGLIKRGQDRWPAHPMLWFAKYDHLLFNGRPEAAAAFVVDPDARPSTLSKTDIEQLGLVARAVASQSEADIEQASKMLIDLAKTGLGYASFSASALSLVGRLDPVFAILDRYLLNRGPFGTPTPIAEYSRRSTSFLFGPGMKAARADPRFAQLTKDIGLPAYWRATGSRPDLAE
jgi:DNA-binding winged helix-turn-helix (wHTH) protein/tetratricopeptide (TPR) repeat protein